MNKDTLSSNNKPGKNNKKNLPKAGSKKSNLFIIAGILILIIGLISWKKINIS
ncbi:TPA: LPXTG cell wall anchor domain-containing protein [Enterococcus faecium]